MIVAIVVVALAAGAAIFLYVTRARRTPVATLPDRPHWTDAAGAGFAELSESGRCDMIFALAVLEDSDSLALIEGALDDPSDTVALAAAHALAARGEPDRLQRYFAAHPGHRAARIAHTLALLDAGVTPSS